MLSTAAPASAQPMTAAQALKQVAPFYEMLNQPAGKDLKALAEQAMAPDWKSYSSETEFKTREAFVAQVTGFGKAIPNLKWVIKDVLVDGDRIVVRSEASGTPVAPLFGVAPSGKTFRIMTIDIHTIKDGRAIAAHHVEDWAGAIRQLSAPAQ
jgi:predicted ester cyclase